MTPTQKRNPIFIGIVIAILAVIILVAFTNAQSVLAVNLKCPKNKTCFLAKHEETGNIACRFNINKPWQWFLEGGEKQPCGEQEEKPLPLPTRRPPNPNPVPPVEDKDPKKLRPDITIEELLIAQPEAEVCIDECPWCDLMTRLVEAEESQAESLELIANELTK